jgi:Glutaredoxin-like domain (DUF836)
LTAPYFCPIAPDRHLRRGRDSVAGVDTGVRVVLLGRAGCHLCEDARAVVSRVCADLGIDWREDDVASEDTPAELRRRHADDIPVTFVDGEVHDFWRVDEGRLRAALAR